MILSNSKTMECKIEGTFENIESELIVLLANIIHELVIPMGVDPVKYMAKCTSVAMAMSEDDSLFEQGRKTVIMIPRKEEE